MKHSETAEKPAAPSEGDTSKEAEKADEEMPQAASQSSSAQSERVGYKMDPATGLLDFSDTDADMPQAATDKNKDSSAASSSSEKRMIDESKAEVPPGDEATHPEVGVGAPLTTVKEEPMESEVEQPPLKRRSPQRNESQPYPQIVMRELSMDPNQLRTTVQVHIFGSPPTDHVRPPPHYHWEGDLLVQTSTRIHFAAEDPDTHHTLTYADILGKWDDPGFRVPFPEAKPDQPAASDEAAHPGDGGSDEEGDWGGELEEELARQEEEAQAFKCPFCSFRNPHGSIFCGNCSRAVAEKSGEASAAEISEAQIALVCSEMQERSMVLMSGQKLEFAMTASKITTQTDERQRARKHHKSTVTKTHYPNVYERWLDDFNYELALSRIGITSENIMEFFFLGQTDPRPDRHFLRDNANKLNPRAYQAKYQVTRGNPMRAPRLHAMVCWEADPPHQMLYYESFNAKATGDSILCAWCRAPVMSWGGYCETCGDIFCNECTKFNRSVHKDNLPITYTVGRTNPVAITEGHSTSNADAGISLITGQPMLGDNSAKIDDLYRNPQRVTRSEVHASSAPQQPRVQLLPNQRSRQHSEQSWSDYDELRREDRGHMWKDYHHWQDSNANWQRQALDDHTSHIGPAMNPRNDPRYEWGSQGSGSSWRAQSWYESSESSWQGHGDRHYSNWRDGY